MVLYMKLVAVLMVVSSYRSYVAVPVMSCYRSGVAVSIVVCRLTGVAYIPGNNCAFL